MIEKLKTIVFIGICFLSVCAFSQGKNSLEKADSLFMSKKYTQAFELYDAQFESGKVTPAMLLKMAFIKEGLRDHVSALYFLNQYYFLTADKSVLYKMEELAEEQNLSGYQVGDSDFFQTNLLRFQDEIVLALAFISLFLLIATISSSRKDRMPIGLPIVQVLVLGALLVSSNGLFQSEEAIIKDNAVLMTGPSAAAEPLEVVEPGHKLQLLDESDVWVKVNWEGEQVFIRKSKLLRL